MHTLYKYIYEAESTENLKYFKVFLRLTLVYEGFKCTVGLDLVSIPCPGEFLCKISSNC